MFQIRLILAIAGKTAPPHEPVVTRPLRDFVDPDAPLSITDDAVRWDLKSQHHGVSQSVMLAIAHLIETFRQYL
jgi:hypothetical protein